ncbi:MAG: hypothetical protein AAF196_14995 [Planctomycetota bacterium]
MKPLPWTKILIAGAVLAANLVIGCVTQTPTDGELHRWWSGLGPVLPHDTFPAECSLCHKGEAWNELVEDFEFDHANETGVALDGAHSQAQCLRCHNDRGPVEVFASRGCAGCHQDFHQGELGQDCQRCHTEQTWRAVGQREIHSRTRFPLTGAHAQLACHRCHPGAFQGSFFQVDTTCVTCHLDDLQQTQNPPHIPLGWVDNCDRCHPVTSWNNAIFR